MSVRNPVYLIGISALLIQANAAAESVDAGDLGVVEAPVAGSVDVPLSEVPYAVMHAAQVAFAVQGIIGAPSAAQFDKDEVGGVWELSTVRSNGRLIEADILPDGSILELEIEIGEENVPQRVLDALTEFAPMYEVSTEAPVIEKSVRPSAIGLSEIWYEFAGTTFDVEVRSDGHAILIEPA